MAHLIENAAIKWGFGWEGSVDYRIDDSAPGRREQIVQLLHRARLRRLVAADAAVLRGGTRAGGGRPRRRGPAVRLPRLHEPGDGTRVRPRGPARRAVARPRARRRAPRRLGAVARLGRLHAATGAGGSRRCSGWLGCCARARRTRGSRTCRSTRAIRTRSDVRPGARRRAHLGSSTSRSGRRRIECHRIDYGPGGLLAAQRAVVYAELGPGAAGDPGGRAAARPRGRPRGAAQLPRARTSSPAARSPPAGPPRSGPSPFARCCATRPSARSATTRTRSCCSGC